MLVLSNKDIIMFVFTKQAAAEMKICQDVTKPPSNMSVDAQRQLRRAEPLHVKQIGPHLHLLLSYSAITTDSETIICMALRILACGSCGVLQIDCDRQKRTGKSSKHVSIIDAMSDV